MTKLLLLAIVLWIPGQSLGQVIWFSDDFHSTQLDEKWYRAVSAWSANNGVLGVNSKSYDELLASQYYVYATQPFSFEVTLRGIRAGVYFSLDDPKHKALSQMIRFDEKSILAGYFDGAGEYTATSVYEIPKLPTDWSSLRIDIDPVKKFYAIYLDGSFLGADTNLVFSSGYIGLQASDGLSEFKSVKVYGSLPARSASLPALGSELSFQHVSFVQTRGNDFEIYVPELQRLILLDSDGRWKAARTPSLAPELTSKVKSADRVFLIVNKSILIEDSTGDVVDSLSEHLVSPSCLAVMENSVFVADPGAKAVFQYSSDGQLINTIDASIIGGFKAPRGIDVFQGTRLVVADYDRLVFCDQLDSTSPTITPSHDGRSCQITWRTTSSTHPWLEYSSDDQRWIRIAPDSFPLGTTKTLQLQALTPLTRYSFRYAPSLKTVPQRASSSKLLRFSTPSSNPQMMSYSRLPIMCMVYRTISYRDKYPRDRFPQVPDGRTLTEDDLTYLKRATEFNREFCFRNSGCKLVLDFDFYVVEDTLWLHEVGDSDPYWLSPNDRVARDYELAARSFGKRPEEYAGLICPYAWVNYPARRISALRDPSKGDSASIRQAVGGGTYGVPAPWRYGKNSGYTSNPFQDRFSRQDWLITHEFHHQIDALMDASGYPEYYHADQPWKMPGRFGEDFDFNAQIMRKAVPTSWLTLRFGKLAQTIDADHDGVPDDDPSLPFDEKRLGSNPASTDTDGDGVSDLAEVMMGTSRGSDLNKSDTDGDGIPDGIDREPLYPINPNIAKVENLGELRTHPFGRIRSSSISADFFMAWNDSALFISSVTDKPANLLVQLDANNDGWFHGFDNIQIRVLNNGDSAAVADYYLRDCSSWINSPKDRRDILRKADLGLSWESSLSVSESSANRHRLIVRIPRNDQYGFRLVPGHQFSIRVGVQTVTDLWVWEELFERNYMMQVRLQ